MKQGVCSIYACLELGSDQPSVPPYKLCSRTGLDSTLTCWLQFLLFTSPFLWHFCSFLHFIFIYFLQALLYLRKYLLFPFVVSLSCVFFFFLIKILFFYFGYCIWLFLFSWNARTWFNFSLILIFYLHFYFNNLFRL